MFRFIRLLSIFVVIALASVAQADPIEDLSMDSYEAGWYPNFYKGKGPMTCPQTCEIWTGARSESEYSYEVDKSTRRTNVCKVTNREEIILEPIDDPKSHWLYGNQFDDYPICYVHPAEKKPFRSELFMCECVRPKKDACEQPDLVVAKIADPVWDSANDVSVVKVTISNIGGSAAGTFYSRVIDPDTNANDVQGVSSLSAGASVTKTFTFDYWVFDPNAELEATADYKGMVEECNEDNNQLTYFKEG